MYDFDIVIIQPEVSHGLSLVRVIEGLLYDRQILIERLDRVITESLSQGMGSNRILNSNPLRLNSHLTRKMLAAVDCSRYPVVKYRLISLRDAPKAIQEEPERFDDILVDEYPPWLIRLLLNERKVVTHRGRTIKPH